MYLIDHRWIWTNSTYIRTTKYIQIQAPYSYAAILIFNELDSIKFICSRAVISFYFVELALSIRMTEYQESGGMFFRMIFSVCMISNKSEKNDKESDGNLKRIQWRKSWREYQKISS